jgi:hypothetical protein
MSDGEAGSGESGGLRPGRGLKRAGALNALRHGLSSGRLVLPSESLTVFEGFAKLLNAELAPVGPIEEYLAHRVVACAWRLLRVERLEGSLSARPVAELLELVVSGEGADHGWRVPDPHAYDGLAKLARHEAAIERSFYRALGALRQMQAERAARPRLEPGAGDGV